MTLPEAEKLLKELSDSQISNEVRVTATKWVNVKTLLSAAAMVERERCAENKRKAFLEIAALAGQAGGMTLRLWECIDDIEKILNPEAQQKISLNDLE